MNELYTLVNKARGDRTIREFCTEAQLPATTFTRIGQGVVPRASTLRKIADVATNGVTYQQLLDARPNQSKPKAERNLVSGIELVFRCECQRCHCNAIAPFTEEFALPDGWVEPANGVPILMCGNCYERYLKFLANDGG